MESAVEITRELAWKPRCAVIMFVNVWARSTLDISTAPACVEPVPPTPGVFTVRGPELAEADQVLPPLRSRPDAFGNVASVMRKSDLRVPVAPSMYDTPPVASMATPVASAGILIADSVDAGVVGWA